MMLIPVVPVAVIAAINASGTKDARYRAAGIVVAVYLSFFLFYSGYKKSSPTDKGFTSFKGSMDITGELGKIFCPAALISGASNKQLNKVAALGGLVLCGLASLPGQLAWKGWSMERGYVLKSGAVSLVLHMMYSVVGFYKLSPMKLLKGQGKNLKFEQLALVAGSCSLSAFVWSAFRYGFLQFLGFGPKDDPKILAAACLLGVTHFYFMETKSGLVEDLPVRPWGYIAFIVPTAAVCLWWYYV